MKQILIFLCFIATCDLIISQNSTVNYIESNLDFPNPERGFYTPTSTSASSYNALVASELADLRNPHTPFNANYDVMTTLVHRYFILDNFVSSDITTSFLNNMQNDFDQARLAGVKLIVRFSYTNTPPTGNCGSWICPPYGDASKSRVLSHIQQLKPILMSNSDVIASLQMGFIGVWGENYYTDHFGDASMSPYIITNANWTKRNEVLDSLLNALPESRTVQVRYPQLKQRLIYGLGSPTNSNPLTEAEAFSGTHKARIGFHNDCLLASDTDFGTYNDYGPPVSSSDTSNLKPYLAEDSRFVPVGGETCFINNPDDNCNSESGRADTELRRMHYSYLNSEYNNDVNNDWVDVCLDEIKKNLGYRFVLESGVFPNTGTVGENISITFNLSNVGYTSPYNQRGLELVLRNTITNALFFAPLDHDPRTWFSGSHSISSDICISPNIPPGNYELLLNLPDPEPTLYDNPDYSIQLANENVWESTTGYNKLNHTLQISQGISNNECSGPLQAIHMSVYNPNYCKEFLLVENNVDNGVYNAKVNLSSNSIIDQNNYMIFKSEGEINLNNEFEVKLGSQFKALIENCYNGN